MSPMPTALLYAIEVIQADLSPVRVLFPKQRQLLFVVFGRQVSWIGPLGGDRTCGPLQFFGAWVEIVV